MEGPSDAGETPLVLWRVARLSLAYLLDTIEISRAGGDLLDPLIVAAVLEANLAPLNQSQALQLDYAAEPPPDELRRPVSINAVAQSLGLPFETVRRRVHRLAEAGACRLTGAGVIVPRSALATSEYERGALARYERLKRFYWDLTEAGALPYLRAADAAEVQPRLYEGQGPPVRLANRLLAEYVMRFIDSVMRRMGDPLTGVILLEMVRANTEHLTAAEQEASIPIPDRLRRPVPVAWLARRMNLPPETIRRRVTDLVGLGFCRRVAGGYVVEAAGAARPGVHSLIVENGANVQRLFVRLGRLGVLAYWERELGAEARAFEARGG